MNFEEIKHNVLIIVLKQMVRVVKRGFPHHIESGV